MSISCAKERSPFGGRNSSLLWGNAIALALFLTTTAFSLLLAYSMLRNFTSESLLRVYGIIADNLDESIERNLRFGRPLAGFSALQDRLTSAAVNTEGIAFMAVLDTRGVVVASFPPLTDMPPKEQDDPHTKTLLGWRLDQGNWLRRQPLTGIGGNKEGCLLTAVSEKTIASQSALFIKGAIPLSVLLGVVAYAILTGWTAYLATQCARERLPTLTRRMLFGVFGGAQILLTCASLFAFSHFLDTSMHLTFSLSGNFFAADIENLVHKKVDVPNIPNLQAQLRDMVEKTPELGGASLRMSDGQVISFGRTEPDSFVTIPVWSYWPSLNIRRTQAATLHLWPDRTHLGQTLRNAALDLLTALAVSLLFLFELSSFVSMATFGAHTRKSKGEAPARALPQQAVIRAVMFFFFLGYDMVLSFVPLAASRLPGSIPFVPDSLLAALPISVEAGAAGLGLVMVGLLSARVGWKTCFKAAFICAASGAALCAAAPNIAVFTLGRMLSGIGFGMTLMSGQLAVIAQSPSRASALAGLYASVFAGSICGSASGAMLYQLFDAVFAFRVSALLFLLPLALAFLLQAPERMIAPARSTGTPWGKLRHIAASADFHLPLLLVSIPASMCLTGFLYLAVPTQLQQLGVLQADTGRLFMLYGLCFVLIGPTLARFADRFANQRAFVCATGMLAGLAVICAANFPGYGGYTLAVLLTGISQCLLTSSMMAYILSLPLAGNFDTGLLGSVCRMCERAGQMLGPLVFGTLLTGWGGLGMTFLGIVFCGAAAIFFLAARLFTAEKKGALPLPGPGLAQMNSSADTVSKREG